MGRLLILADDFTGACDAAGALAGRGGSVLVVLAAPPMWPAEVDVLSVDLDLREQSNTDAHSQIESVARRVCESAPQARVFLKIDSTLRGPIAGLVSGALRGSQKEVAVIAPAFPEQGRLLRDGRLVVDGQLGASLMTMLGAEGTVLLVSSVARSSEMLEAAVVHARLAGARRVVVDAETSESLKSVADAWSRHADWLAVGSSGLAREVRPSGGSVPFDIPPASGRVLVIAGSPSPMTQAQIEHLRPLAPVTIVERDAVRPDLPPPHHLLVVVCTPPANERDTGESSRAVAETVLEWSTKAARPGAVVLAGGATARQVCERLGAEGVSLVGELAPGVPIGHLVGGDWDTVSVVTKAGGFGTPTTLLDVVRALLSTRDDAEVSQ